MTEQDVFVNCPFDRHYRLPRFNMPLELGLFLGAKTYGSADQQAKRCLILDKKPYRYQRFCSDLAGQDIRAHGGKPNALIEVVRNWLSSMRATSTRSSPAAP